MQRDILINMKEHLGVHFLKYSREMRGLKRYLIRPFIGEFGWYHETFSSLGMESFFILKGGKENESK